MKSLFLIENPLVEPLTFEVEDVCKFLKNRFEKWPSSARIYEKHVSDLTDITPNCENDIKRLQESAGPFYVIVYPEGPMQIIFAIILVASVALAFRKPPIPTIKNTQTQSPNNELSGRSNTQRIGNRIPDIFGTVKSTPDLIAVPYNVFINHEEVEYSFMCIGRGFYDIDDDFVYDDTTKVKDIAGLSVEIYEPFTSPNSGTPQLSIGAAIETPVYNAKRLNSVNGQVLRSPNDQNIRGIGNIRFHYPNEIQTSDYNFTEKFFSGDSLVIEHAVEYESYINQVKEVTAYDTGYFRFLIPSSTLPDYYVDGAEILLTGALFNVYETESFVRSYDLSGSYQIDTVELESETIEEITTYYCRVNLLNPEDYNPQWLEAYVPVSAAIGIRLPSGIELYNLSGTYEILSVSESLIVLSDPGSINSDWDIITTTNYISAILSTSGAKWIGPFSLNASDMTDVFCNFVALNGLYKDDGNNQIRIDVVLEIELTPVNSSGVEIGTPETFQVTLQGSSAYKSTRAVTLKAKPTFTGLCKVRARRVTESDLEFQGQVVDEIKWRDCYSMQEIENEHFGNLTTLQSVTYATESALNVKDRKLNLKVTRKIPLRVSGSTFTTELHPTNDGAEIFSFLCLDERIGNRQVSEIDFDNVYDTIAEIKEYFGTDLAAEFNYTFDSNNLSFEETLTTLAESLFCVCYRTGNVLKLSFEKETEESTLLFNHRNKLPGSELRTVTFGNQENHDGVSYEYVDPEDDAVLTIFIPEDQSAINPKEIESVGVRSKIQAYFHAWRAWNKIRYQNMSLEFTATQEADLLVLNDRILVTDGTRPFSQEGEIIEQNGLELTLSQSVDLTLYVDYVIFLQHYDGSVESIDITAGSSSRKVVLANAPRLPLVTDCEMYARTLFVIVGNSEPGRRAFLVNEKETQNNFTSIVKAVSYSEKYYQNDKDFINGIIDVNGNII